MSIVAPGGRGKIDSPAASRSPISGASASATAASAIGPGQLARLDERHERRRCVLVDLDGRVLVLDRREVGVRADRRRRGDHADPPVAGRQRGGRGAGPDDAEDRQVVAAPERTERDGGRGVAGDDDGLDVALGERVEATRARSAGPRRRSGRRTGRGRCRRDRSSIRRASGGGSRAGPSGRRPRSRRRRSDADPTSRLRPARRAAATRPAPRSSRATPHGRPWLICAFGLASTNGTPWLFDWITSRPSDTTLVLGDPAERPLEVGRVEAAGRVGAVDQVADLRRRVADRAERVGHRDRVVDRRRVVGDDLDDRVALRRGRPG